MRAEMRPLIRITAYAFRHKWLSIIAATLGVINVFPQLIIPRLLGVAIDEMLTGEIQGNLLFIVAIILLLSLLKGRGFFRSTPLTHSVYCEMEQLPWFQLFHEYEYHLQSHQTLWLSGCKW